jgi:hypothetical protein
MESIFRDESMFHTLYTISVLVANPTIPADFKALGDSQFQVREAATKRLGTLPSWTANYFKYHAQKAADPEVRIRCERVYETLSGRRNCKIGSIQEEWLKHRQQETGKRLSHDLLWPNAWCSTLDHSAARAQ